jgi:hypothetical protein
MIFPMLVCSFQYQIREKGLCVCFSFGRRSGCSAASKISGEEAFENASRRQGCVACRFKAEGLGRCKLLPTVSMSVFISRDARLRSGKIMESVSFPILFLWMLKDWREGEDTR